MELQEEEQINEKERLQLIESMIMQAQQSLNDNGFIWLTWGWLVFIASLLQFALLKMEYYAQSYYPWVILMPLGCIITVVWVVKEARKSKVKTYVDEFMAYLWSAFSISTFIYIVFFYKTYSLIIPVILVLYGIGTFVSGGAIRFRPLIIGGIICWIAAIISFNVEMTYQLFLIAISVLCSYIIPGYILRSRSK